MSEPVILACADGRIFRGRRFGAYGKTSGEVVFNTGMTGYQEILTDPSYRAQIVCMTYPHIGNYGVNAEDVESDAIHAAGFIVREGEDVPSSWRSEGSLSEYLLEAGIVGITGIDTRALTRHLRQRGALNAVIGPADDPEALVAAAQDVPPMVGRNLVDEVTCGEPYEWKQGLWDGRVVAEGAKPYRIAVFDFGVKQSILRALVSYGFEVTVVPSRTSAKEVLDLKPDGIMLSNGPGDPAAVGYAVETIRELLGQRPIFGVCLGHQLLALAIGADTYKLKFGHHGCNHPVKDQGDGSVAITSQNHGFAVSPDGVSEPARVTHINLYDGTIEGLEKPDVMAFSVQYHPEAAPGPHDARNLFAKFRSMVEGAG